MRMMSLLLQGSSCQLCIYTMCWPNLKETPGCPASNPKAYLLLLRRLQGRAACPVLLYGLWGPCLAWV